jgi:uncharacterized protein (DUF58 family)
MRFVFTKLFYVLLGVGFIPLSLSWGRPVLRWATLGFDIVLITLALIDARMSRWPAGVEVLRSASGRFAVGAETEVRVRVLNNTPRGVTVWVKDEFPPEMQLKGLREARIRVEAQETAALVYELKPPKRGRFVFGQTALRYLSRFGLAWCQRHAGEPFVVKVYPNMRRAREAELKALGARSLVAAHRRSSWRGEGREFESLRDYVRGDELRHVSWTATARRGKLVTRQYQIERDQTILIALDAGRLMTARIERETKLDLAPRAAAIMQGSSSSVVASKLTCRPNAAASTWTRRSKPSTLSSPR